MIEKRFPGILVSELEDYALYKTLDVKIKFGIEIFEKRLTKENSVGIVLSVIDNYLYVLVPDRTGWLFSMSTLEAITNHGACCSTQTI